MDKEEQKQTEQTATFEGTANKKPKKWLVPTIIGAVIVIVLALCGGGYYYHFTHTMKDYMPNSYVTFKQTDSKMTMHMLGQKETNSASFMNGKTGFVLAKNGKFYNLKKAEVPSKESVASYVKGKDALGTYEFKGNDKLILHFSLNKLEETNPDLKDLEGDGVKYKGKTVDFTFSDMKGSLQKELKGKSNMTIKMSIDKLNATGNIHGNVTNMKVTRR
ncbi:hypothetical protein ACI3E1_00390 [Ligilactobacillus sp. LYQ139]|uniref:hypothetical protein n=1 Tax=Ligilactobacillus sp. LYQ139 TaxID=3378800 RepID=UPI003853D9D2